MMRSRRLASILAIAGFTAMSLTGASTANAAQLESGTVDFRIDETFDDCGFAVHQTGRLYGSYTISKGTNRTGGEFFRTKQHIIGDLKFTNDQTGDYFTERFHTRWREMPATVVDEAGPVVTYQVKESGVWDTIQDSTGKIRYRSTGTLVFEYVFDTGGDGAPGGGEFISEEFVRTSGNWQTFDADFCQIVDDLIG